MEFADVGAHCAYDLCGQQTFLPFECESCNRKFCKLHFEQEAHRCIHLADEEAEAKQKELAQVERNKKSKINKPIYKCHRRKCKKKEWIKIECNKCRRTFCLKHRSPDDHKCQGPVAHGASHCAKQVMMAQSGKMGFSVKQSPSILVQ